MYYFDVNAVQYDCERRLREAEQYRRAKRLQTAGGRRPAKRQQTGLAKLVAVLSAVVGLK